MANIPTIAVGGSQTVTFKARITDTGAKINKAQISKSDQYDVDSQVNNGTQNGEDDTDSVRVVVNQADLSLKKTVSNTKPNVGENFTYTITVSNAGPSTATNVEVKDYLPEGLTFVSSSDFALAGTILTAKIDTIKSGTNKVLTIVAKTTKSGTITNKAEISKSDQFDPDSKPNNGTENGEDDQDRVTIGSQIADLSLVKTVSNPKANVGDIVTFTMTVTNIGPDSATNVKVKDVLPAGLELINPVDFTDNSGALISKNIASIAPNGTAKLSFVARISRFGVIVNKAEIITSDQFDPDSQPNTGTEDGQDDIGRVIMNGQQADLSLQKNVSNTSPNLGEIITYTINVSNAGPNNATNIEVKDVLPAGLQFVNSSNFINYAGILIANLDSVVVGQTVSLTFQAKNINNSTIQPTTINRAEISRADQFDPDSSPNNGTENGEDDTDGVSFTTQSADLSIKKGVSAGPYNVGDNVTYTITVKNNGPSLATNVVVTDSLPSSLSFVSGVGFINNNGKITAGIGSLATGTTQTLTVIAKITKSGSIQNTGIIVKSDQFDPDTKNNRDSVIISTQKAADLSLRKTVSNRTPSVGSNVTFTIYVKNSGPDAAQNVQVKDYMPTGLTFVSSGTPAATDFTLLGDGNLLSKNIPTIANGDSVALAFVAQVSQPVSIVNKAEISKSDTYDPDSQPNTGTSDGQDDTGGVTLNGQEADLSLTKSVDNANPNVGDVVTYTIKVSNAGPNIATNVEVQDVLPNGLEIVSAGDFTKAGNVLSAAFASIGIKETKTLIFSAKVLAPTSSTTIINKAQITKSDQYDPDSNPNSGTEDGQDDTDDAVINIQQADLSLKKTFDGPTSIKVGSIITYHLTVSNAGPSTATNVEVKDILPLGLELVNATDFVNNNGTLTASIPSLLGGTSRTLSFTAKITQAGNVLNSAEITKSDQFDPDSKVGNGINNAEDDRAEVSTFGRSADLSLTKSVSDSVVTSLQTVTYTIEVRNAGPDAVGQFTVKDYMPTGIEFISSKYFTNSAGTLSATIFNVKKDSVVKLTFMAKIKKTVLDNVAANNLLPVYFLNKAEITDSDTPDPDSQPNNGTDNGEDDTDNAQLRVRVADLSLRKLVSNQAPQIGQVFEYKLVVMNNGPDFATNVQVRDILPTGLEFVSSNDFANNNGVLLSKNIVKIESGKADTLKFTAKVNTSNPVTNRAEISKSDQLDPDSEVNNGLQNGEDDEASVTVGGQVADLSLTKDVDNATPNVGNVITYSIKVKNSGPSKATNVQVHDYLPRGLQVILDPVTTSEWTMLDDSTMISKNIAEILPNSTVTFLIKVRVTALALARGYAIKNYAEISKSDQYDIDSQPNTGYGDGQDDTDDAEIKIQYADLSLVKTASNRKPRINEEIDYTLTVTNDGVSNATNVEIKDILPKGLQFVSGSGWTKSGDTLRNLIPLINSGTSRSVSFKVKVLVPGALTNKAEISKADQYDPDSPHGNGTGKGEDDESGVLINGEQADLSLVKMVSNKRPNVGDTLTYSISVRNAGPDVATNVQVKDKLPKGIEFIQSQDFDNLTSILYGNIAKIGKDSTVVLTYTAKVMSATAFTNYAEITKSDQYDPDSQPNSGTKDGQDDTDNVTVKPRTANLSLQKLADRRSTNIGSNILFSLLVKNAGPDSATNVVVRDILPIGLEFISSPGTPAADFTMSNDFVLTSKAITVAPNSVDTLTFVARVTKEGLITNKAEIIKSDVFDPNSKPNTGTEDGEDDNSSVTVGGEQADLSLVKTVADQFVNVGKTTIFTIKVSNAGPSIATNVQVKDFLPKGLIFVSSPDFVKASDSLLISKNINQIAVNQTIKMTVEVMVTKDFYNKLNINNTLTNRAEITKADQYDPDSQPDTGIEDSQDDQSKATITVPISDLSLKKTVSNPTATIGSEVIYTITVTNDGNDNATNVEVKDYLPKGLTIVKLNDFTQSKTGDTLSLKIGRINAGDSKSFTYTAKILAGGSIINKAEITKSDQFDSDSQVGNGTGKGEDDEATVTIGGESADLEIKKTVSNRKPNVGENITYTITVKNNGPNTATNVEVKDYLPEGLVFVNSKDFNLSGTILTAQIDSIKLGESKILTLIARLVAPPSGAGGAVNVAQITKSDQFDPNLKNNKDSVSIGGKQADLSLIKLVNKPNANLGEQVTYKLIVRNAGADTATNVVVRDVLPASLGFVASTDFTMSGSALISRKILKIAPNKADTLIFIAKVKDKGMIMNCAEIFKADQSDPDSQVGNGTNNGEDDEACAMLNGDQADLSLIKGVDGYATTPNVGDTISYVLEVRNAGPGIATRVQVSDILPKGIQFLSSSGTPAADFTKNTVSTVEQLTSRTIDSIKVGSSVKLKFKVKITSVGGEEVANTIINRAEITKSDQFDPDSQPNTGTADGQDDAGYFAVMPQIADLSLKKNVSNRSPLKGQTVTYTLTVYNAGPALANNVEVKDILPSGLTFVSSSDFKATGSTLIAKIPAIAAGTSQSVDFIARVTSNSAIINKAEINKADQFDPDSPHGNGTDKGEDDEASVIINGKQADLSLRKTVDNTKPNLGDTLTYKLTIRNAGPDEATNVQVQDYLPAGLTMLESYDLKSVKNVLRNPTPIAIIAPDDSVTIEYTALVNRFAQKCVLTNKAEIWKASEFDPDSKVGNGVNIHEDDTDSATVCIQSADLSLKKKVDKYKVNTGENITYSITVFNNGPLASTNVKVQDILPTGLKFVSTNDDIVNNKGKLTLSVDKIESGKSFTWEFVALVTTATAADNKSSITNNAQIIESDQFDPDSKPNNGMDNDEDDEASVTINAGTADLSIRKDVSPWKANVGQNVTFTITVSNNGPSTGTNIHVRDILPEGLKFISSNDFDYNETSRSLIGKLDSVQVGKKEKLTFIAKILKPTTQQFNNSTITNKVEITKADQFDLNSYPNSGMDDGEDDTDSVTVNGRGADLSLEKFVSNAKPNVGGEVTFTLRVRNAGPELARNTIVKDYLPAELALTEKIDFFNTNEGIISRVIPVIQPNTYVDLTFKAKVLKGGLITNRAEIFDTHQYDADSQTNTGTEDGQDDVGVVTLIAQQADLSLNKIVNHTEVTVGDTLLYMVQVNNAGPSEATNVEVSDLLPDGLQLVESNNGTLVGNLITFKAASIEKGGIAVFGYKVLVTKAGSLVNKAQVSKSDQPDPDSTPGNGKFDGSEDDEASCVVRAKLPCDKIAPNIIASKTELSCSDKAILTALGCSGEVNWSDGQKGNSITVNPTGNVVYTATCVMSSTCVSNVSKEVYLTVTLPTAPVITAPKTQICGGDSVTFVSSGCKGMVIWSNGKMGVTMTDRITSTTSYTAICREGECRSPRSNEITVKAGIEKPIVTCGRERLCLGESEVLKAHGCENGKVTWSDGQIGQTILVKPTKTAYQFTAICEVNTCKSEPSVPAYFIVSSCGKDSLLTTNKPMVALCKEAQKPVLVSGKTYDITYDFRVVNVGNTDFEKLQLQDNLNEVFTAKGAKIKEIVSLKADEGLTVNKNYNGQSDQTLLIDTFSSLAKSKIKGIQLVVRVDFTDAKVDTFYNSANVMAKAGNVIVQDVSNNGMDINPDGDNDPTDDSKPTPIRVLNVQKPSEEPKEVFIPEGFSPNGDGINDLFVIDLTDKALTINLQIYNRWGGLVYAQEEYQNNWDGTANQGINPTGKTGLPDGTYFYMVRLSNGKEFVRSMTLMR